VLVFGLRNDTASIVRSATESGKRAVLFLTSDRNLEDAGRRGRKDRGVYGERGILCRYALEHADHIVVQTPKQQELLQLDFGIRGSLIPNPIDIETPKHPVPRANPPMALWVGRADTFSKRADICVELARRCPAISFTMIMNRHDELLFDQITNDAPRNLQIIERVPFPEIDRYYQRATVLVSTSLAEGFPNSFLQAGKFGTPVVSLNVDPAEMLTKHQCGSFAGGELHHLAASLETLCAGGPQFDLASRNIREYVSKRHDAKARCDDLCRVLDQLPSQRRAA
jgi:glycosyltransferase involved in cell wall biosynthesis